MTTTEVPFAVGDRFNYVTVIPVHDDIRSMEVVEVRPMRFTEGHWWIRVKNLNTGREYDGSDTHWLGGAFDIVRNSQA